MPVSYSEVIIFLLIFMRISGLFIAAPFLASRVIPRTVKVGLAFIISIVVFPLVSKPSVPLGTNVALALAVIKEVMVGYLLGLLVAFIMSAIQIAGRLMDFQMGFAMVNVVDPQYGGHVPLTGQIGYVFTLLVFLAVNGHHFLLRTLVGSFSAIPLLNFSLISTGMGAILRLFITSFVLALRIASPVMGALFLASVALGIIARTVPQMNVFVVGLPAKIVIGIAVLVLMMPVYLWSLEAIFSGSFDQVLEALFGTFGGR